MAGITRARALQEARAPGWLLTKIRDDDLVTDAQGQVQLGEGAAPERIGNGDIQATCADLLEHAVDLVVPTAQPADSEIAHAGSRPR